MSNGHVEEDCVDSALFDALISDQNGQHQKVAEEGNDEDLWREEKIEIYQNYSKENCFRF